MSGPDYTVRIDVVHLDGDPEEAYGQTQWDDDIHDGDVLVVDKAGIYGFLLKAWPVAVVGDPQGWHAMTDEAAIREEGYGPAIDMARRLGQNAESAP